MGFQHALYFSAEDCYPELLNNRSEYATEEIQKRIAWIEARRQRNMSPRAEHLLRIYMANLQQTSKQGSNFALRVVQRVERKIMYGEACVAVPDREEMEMINRSKELTRLRLLDRYGDELAKMVELPKSQLEEQAGLGGEEIELLWEYWTVVQGGIVKDRRLQEERKSQKRDTLLVDTPTIQAVTLAAKGLLIDPDELLAAVRCFVLKGPKSRANLDQVIALRKPHDLADTIFADLQFLVLSQAVDESEAKRYRDITITLRDKHFTLYSDEENEPEMWNYTDQYREEMARMSGTVYRRFRTSGGPPVA